MVCLSAEHLAQSIQSEIKHGMMASLVSPTRLSQFFSSLIEDHTSEENPCVILPSIASLSECLGASSDTVLASLRLLRQRGYDFAAGGLYGTLSLFRENLKPTQRHSALKILSMANSTRSSQAPVTELFDLGF